MTAPDFFHAAPELRVASGEGALVRLGRELDRLKASRAVIFCGRTMAASPLTESLREALGPRCAGLFDGVKAHTPLPSVETAAALLADIGADAAVAVGGGSAVVTARAASILYAENRPVAEMATFTDEHGRMQSPRLTAPKIPQLIVPTTPTTAMVKAGTAVFDPATGARLAMFDPKTRAAFLALHPGFLTSAPMALAQGAGLDSLCLGIEGLTSRAGDPIADALLIHGVRLLHRGLSRLKTGDGPDLRRDLALGAVMVGRGTDQTGAGIATVLGHAVGAEFHLDNGAVKAAVMPHALRFNKDAAAAGLAKTALALGLPENDPLPRIEAALAEMMAALGAPVRLGEMGVRAEALPRLAEKGMGDWFLKGNPRPVTDAAELLGVLRAAM